MQKRLRLVDIAKKAGVSLGTVDRVVNKRGKVAPHTEEKILEIIREFDYQPNLMASSLSSKKRLVFAVLLPKPQGEDYWHKILSGVEETGRFVKEFGVEIEYCLYNQDDDLRFAELADQILETPADAVILAPVYYRESKEFVLKLEKKKIPYVLVDSAVDGSHPLCTISQDDFRSGMLAAKLIDYGLPEEDELLLISNRMLTDYFELAHERSNGFMAYFNNSLKKQRIIHTLDILHPKYEKLALFLKEMLEQHPAIKGIFIDNSKTHWVARFLNENAITSIRLIGFDLIEQNVRYLHNGTIDFILFDHVEKQGEMGLQAMFDHVIKKKPVKEKINMPIQVVTKENLEGFL